MKLKEWAVNHLNRFKELVAAELSPSKVALAIGIGFSLGVIPFFGVNIFLSFLFAWIFRLNHVIIQFVNSAVYPLQLLGFVPFIKLGVGWFSNEQMAFSGRFLLGVFKEDVIGGIRLLGIWNLYGVLAWMILSVPAVILVYYCTLVVMNHRNGANDEEDATIINSPNMA